MVDGNGIYIDKDACIQCESCVQICPNKAMEKKE